MKPRTLLLALIVAGLGLVLLLPADLRAAETACTDSPLSDCRVLGAGIINDEDGAPLLSWQTQTGFTEQTGIIGGFVLYRWTGEDWTLLDSGFDGYGFTPPLLSESGLLHIAGYSGGTGAYNVDRLYFRGEDEAPSWRRIDIESWREDIDALLPAGLGIWKGVDYDFDDWFYDTLTARTPLWREDDANCCATGGEALIDFEIIEDRLTVRALRYLPPEDEP